jgi:hypothetical protein
VAKRPKSKKTAKRPTRRIRARKPTTRRTRALSEPTGPRPSLPLRDLQRELEAAVNNWNKRISEPSVARAVTMFKRWQSEIDIICSDPNGSPCGPTMDPLA